MARVIPPARPSIAETAAPPTNCANPCPSGARVVPNSFAAAATLPKAPNKASKNEIAVLVNAP